MSVRWRRMQREQEVRGAWCSLTGRIDDVIHTLRTAIQVLEEPNLLGSLRHLTLEGRIGLRPLGLIGACRAARLGC